MSQEELVVDRTRRSFQTGRSKPLEFRLQQLRRLQSFIKERRKDIKDALQKDLGKSDCASELYELLVVEAELQLSLTRLAEWAAPRPVEKNLFTLSDEVYVRPEPLGVVLIVGPWNYPWSLTLLPLVGAIAAGPTVLKNVTGDSRVMQEEIFGPLLPIVTVKSVNEAIHFINEREKPLVLYVFSHNAKLIEKVLAETSSGALVANDCIVHFLDSALPFGGVGHSGMGRYRGRHTFDQLSNLRSCMIKQLKMEGLNSMRYPPHSTKKLGWARRFLLSQLNVQKLRNMAVLAMLTCLAAFVVQRFLR